MRRRDRPAIPACRRRPTASGRSRRHSPRQGRRCARDASACASRRSPPSRRQARRALAGCGPASCDHRRKADCRRSGGPCRHRARCRDGRGRNDRRARAGCRRSWRGSQAPSAICARRASKVFRCASFFGCSGSSAQARWLITSASSKALDRGLRARKRTSTSAAERPSRFMPLSIWMAAGKLRARRRTERRPFFDLVGAVEHRAQAELAIDSGRVLEQPAEHIDGRVGQGARAARPPRRAWRRRRSCSRRAPEPERLRPCRAHRRRP